MFILVGQLLKAVDVVNKVKSILNVFGDRTQWSPRKNDFVL